MDKFVITISRCCGAGGTTIGKRLAADLGVSFYDKNLLHLASEDSGINEELFANADEKLKGSLLYKVSRKVYQGELIPPESEDFTTNENLFNYQAKVLKELAASESYVVIGRCADFILKDHPKLVRIFLYAPYEDCVAHEMEKHSISAKEAQWHIDRTDKHRSEFHKYHTGHDWMEMENYDICINTGAVDYEKTVEIIEFYVHSMLGLQ